MKVVVSAGAKTENIVSAIQSKFKDGGIDFIVVPYIEDIDKIYTRGEYFDKAIIVEQSWNHDFTDMNLQSIRQKVNNFANDSHNRGLEYAEFIFLTKDQEIAEAVYEEILYIQGQSVVMVKSPNYRVSFFNKLIITPIDRIDEDVYKPKMEDEITSNDNQTPVRDITYDEEGDTEEFVSHNFSGMSIETGEEFNGEFTEPADTDGFRRSDFDDAFETPSQYVNTPISKPDQNDNQAFDTFSNPQQANPVNNDWGAPNNPSGFDDQFSTEQPSQNANPGPINPGFNPPENNEPQKVQNNEQVGMDDTFSSDFDAAFGDTGDQNFNSGNQNEFGDQNEQPSMNHSGGWDASGFGAVDNGEMPNQNMQQAPNQNMGDIPNQQPDPRFAGDIPDYAAGAAVGAAAGFGAAMMADQDNQAAGDNFSDDMYGDQPQGQPQADPNQGWDPSLDDYNYNGHNNNMNNMNNGFSDDMYSNPNGNNDYNQPYGSVPQNQGAPGFNDSDYVNNDVVPPVNSNRNRRDQMSNINTAELRSLFDAFAHRGESILVTGCGGCGTSTVALNLANTICNMGYTVLLVDLDTQNKTQSYISKDNYDSLDPDSAGLMAAINSTSGINAHTAIVKQGFHLLTMGMASDAAPINKIVQQNKILPFINLAKSTHNFIIYDIPFDSAVGFCKDFIFMADNIVLTIDCSNWGITKTMLNMCNISSEDVSDAIFNRGQLLFNRYRSLNKVMGRRIKTAIDITKVMDYKVKELLGEEPPYYFQSMHICGLLNEDPQMEAGWYEKVQFSDTQMGSKLYIDILRSILLQQ